LAKNRESGFPKIGRFRSIFSASNHLKTK
jgi:hypothetical protein